MTCKRTAEVLKRLMVVGSAATGFLMSDFSDMHEYIEEIMERPLSPHERGDSRFAEAIKKKAHPDFVAVIKEAQTIIGGVTCPPMK